MVFEDFRVFFVDFRYFGMLDFRVVFEILG